MYGQDNPSQENQEVPDHKAGRYHLAKTAHSMFRWDVYEIIDRRRTMMNKWGILVQFEVSRRNNHAQGVGKAAAKNS